MKYENSNNTLTIYLEGNIDSNNAESIGKEIDEICAKESHTNLVFDLDNLKYISSAGLRQILRFKKKEKNFKLINVSSEIYEIFEMTGFTEMMEIVKAYRKLSVDGCEVIGEGSNGIVYRINPDTIIKVYKNNDALEDIKRERELARSALIHGINTAIPYDVVKVGDKYGSVFELLNAKSLTKLIMENKDNKEELDKYIKIVADVMKEIHNTKMEEGVLPSAREIAINWANYLEGKIPEATYNKLIKMLNEVPESLNVVHGDFHTGNVHYVSGEPIIIDMDTLSVGNPVFEFCNFYNAYHGFSELDHKQVERFLKMDYDTASYVLKKVFDYYFEGKDDAYKEEVLNKAKVIAYTRLLRRTLKREPDNSEMINHCKNGLIEAVDKVDSLAI